MNHTPGPWTLTDGTLLQDSGRKLHIGTFNEAPGLGHAAAANARLICAAPAMLQALQSVLFTLEQEGDASVIAPAYKAHLAAEIRAAIRAATGEV